MSGIDEILVSWQLTWCVFCSSLWQASSGDYILWNTLGKCPTAALPRELWLCFPAYDAITFLCLSFAACTDFRAVHVVPPTRSVLGSFWSFVFSSLLPRRKSMNLQILLSEAQWRDTYLEAITIILSAMWFFLSLRLRPLLKTDFGD